MDPRPNLPIRELDRPVRRSQPWPRPARSGCAPGRVPPWTAGSGGQHRELSEPGPWLPPELLMTTGPALNQSRRRGVRGDAKGIDAIRTPCGAAVRGAEPRRAAELPVFDMGGQLLCGPQALAQHQHPKTDADQRVDEVAQRGLDHLAAVHAVDVGAPVDGQQHGRDRQPQELGARDADAGPGAPRLQ